MCRNESLLMEAFVYRDHYPPYVDETGIAFLFLIR